MIDESHDEQHESPAEPVSTSVIEPEATVAPAQVQAQPESRILPEVSLQVYLVACGRKPDQTAGFRHWCTSRSLGPRTMLDWAQLWIEFTERPIL